VFVSPRACTPGNVPVLFTSIHPATDELLELAPSAYLVKPFPLDSLERALAQALIAAATAAEATATG
jgi:two-component SAPR family response regulator